MSINALSDGAGGRLPCFVGEVDPRARIVATMAFAVTVASLGDTGSVIAAFLFALAVAPFSGLALRMMARRLVMLEGFMILLLVMLPFSVPGEPLMTVGPLVLSQQGLMMAVIIALKANAVVIAILAQLGTLDPVRFGHGLAHLGVPRKLVALLLLTVRYVAVFEDEYKRLRRTMRARGFRASSSVHTWRSLGWLLGMLLVRSNDRGQRVLQAMKCRGYSGRFVIIDDFRFGRRDVLYLLTAAVVLVCLAAGEWL